MLGIKARAPRDAENGSPGVVAIISRDTCGRALPIDPTT
jgi:hypothetical protein